MAAVSVLTLCAVLLYESFFIILDAYGRYSNSLKVSSWMGEKIWDAQDKLTHFKDSPQIETSGTLRKGDKDFIWDLSYNSLGQQAGLYSIRLSLQWQEGKRKILLSRAAYALHED
jgi:hypothetical protein